VRRSYGRCVSRHSRSIKFAVIRTVADDLNGGKRARMTAGPRKPPFTPRWLQRPEWVDLCLLHEAAPEVIAALRRRALVGQFETLEPRL
jgi:hypothetical protein